MTSPTSPRKPAVHPLARFPAEIWSEVATFLKPLDRRVLQLSSKSIYTILSVNAPPPLYPDHQIRLRILAEDDWLHLPAHQVCVICDKYHARQRVQPRSEHCAPPKSDKLLCSCTGGIRLSADKILCQDCWRQLLLGNVNDTPRGFLKDSWLHEWKVEKRRDQLLLRVTSTMSEDVSHSRYHADWDLAAYERQLAGVSWCGCNPYSMKYLLVYQIKAKLECQKAVEWRRYPALGIPDVRNFARLNVGCLCCGTLYTCSVKAQAGVQRVVVERFLNLSSASTFAAHLSLPSLQEALSSSTIPGGRIVEGTSRKRILIRDSGPDLLSFADLGPYIYCKRRYRVLKGFLGRTVARLTHKKGDSA